MGLFKKLKGEFIDIIEWTDSSSDTMVYRFDRLGNEIKYGAQLTVRESQTAVFINEGQLADVFPPGRYELETRNLPVLSTLKGWKHGFNSPFKAEVYFVNIKRFPDLKWGTKGPIPLRDADFGVIRLTAFGTYSIRVSDAAKFLREIVGTKGDFSTSGIQDQLRNIIVARFSDALGESKIPALDLAASYNELGEALRDKIQSEFGEYGLELLKALVERIGLPKSVEEAMDKRSSMGVIGDMGTYTQYQAANAMEAAASNSNSMAGAGMGMGMGMAMANQMGSSMNQQNSPEAQKSAGGPPPLPKGNAYFIALHGKQEGPFDLSVIQSKIASNIITKDTLVWKQGMANWTAAKEVHDINQFFGSAPPPLPPQ